ncbi:sensor domain-containing protein [Haloarchaeobius amylolyticus]|uniref:sensor domain-containing protein n=1 Tax=Haloarchaeobius amylolyticus TaxID=1198296 RepID=UPI00226D9AA3|nr:sensor domain-containing protein [Haloarchaeobius amylolyticus]
MQLSARNPRALIGFLRAPVRLQTYKNLAYLAVQFPLGIAYFTTLVASLALGISLSLVLVGIPLLLGTLVLVTGIVRAEGELANQLLTVDVETRDVGIELEEGLLPYTKGLLLDAGTYIGLVYSLSKLFVGVVTFSLLSFCLSLTGGLLAAPVLYNHPDSYHFLYDTTLTLAPEVRLVDDFWSITFAPIITLSEWNVDTLGEALIVAILGLVVLIISLNILNAFAHGLGLLTARVLQHARSLEV